MSHLTLQQANELREELSARGIREEIEALIRARVDAACSALDCPAISANTAEALFGIAHEMAWRSS